MHMSQPYLWVKDTQKDSTSYSLIAPHAVWTNFPFEIMKESSRKFPIYERRVYESEDDWGLF